MKGRQSFVCIHCGLKFAGRKLKMLGSHFFDGRIVPYDRAPTNELPPEPAVCMDCLEQTHRACADVGRV